MTLQRFGFAVALAALPALTPTISAAAPINAPVPTTNYATIGSLDWAWAAPCDAFGNSCGVVDMTYQSTQGWRIASMAEVSTYILPNIQGFLANFGTSGNFKCASAWFSTVHSHCDWSDASAGNIYNGAMGNFGAMESFALRDAIPTVPVPAAGLLLASLVAGGLAVRRRKS
ncbi:hypothetical protein NX862_04455 [Rhodobacter sp. KR11]|uniref:hypothetical protein n=1 Tax=Rhodobacter sp. KR11 TaxID=2974588 RepID=UPI0022228C22|nr:hypothetical protein [Rhodobacter sp. KR11]MCW1917995.1 hypothetical protein [Rhodobacter sp. KR11]